MRAWRSPRCPSRSKVRFVGSSEKHRCFVAVEEAYASPWFTSLPEEISHAIVLMSVPEPDKDEIEILQEIRRRSPHAVIAWASASSGAEEDRTVVQILAGM